MNPQAHHCTKVTGSPSTTMQPPTETNTGGEMPYLPAEIIFDICNYFTVDPHDPTKGSHASLAIIDNIRALRQLSLTCRGIHTVVTPELYRSVYVTGPMTDPLVPLPTQRQNSGAETLLYFLRTILDNAQLRQYVKDLACLIDLRDRCHFKEEMNTLNKDYGILSTIRDCKDIRTKRLLQRADSWIQRNFESRLGFEAAFGTTSRRPIVSMTHQLFALLACLLPNVTSISLKAGSHDAQYPGWPEIYDFKDIGIAGRVVHKITQPFPLENLRTLQVQCEPENTILDAQNPTINLLDLVPVLRNASNLTHVRYYGFDSTWTGLPDTAASVEFRGPVTTFPLQFPPDTPMLCLRTMFVRLECTSKELDFSLQHFCFGLGIIAPALEHLEVLMSPGTHEKPIGEFTPLYLSHMSGLQHFCFDARLFPWNYWNEPKWQDPEIGSEILPSSIETLRIVDSDSSHHFSSILQWLQVITRFHLRREDLTNLKRIELLHIPALAEADHNANSWDSLELANEVKEELALNDVQLQLVLVDNKGSDASEAESMKQAHISGWASVHDSTA